MGRWTADAGAVLLLLAPALAQISSTTDGTLLPSVFYDPSDLSGGQALMYAKYPRVPVALFSLLHVPVAIVFFRGWKPAAAASLALLYVFLPLYLSVLSRQEEDFIAVGWLSALLAAAAVGAALSLGGTVAGAASVARLSIGMILVQTHALSWCQTGANPLAVSAWTGMLGGLTLAAGELIASLRPASSASAWRPSPLPSHRTSWRRA
ncbi:MAG TPA: hypothetical protein VF950_14740 [Planctomycetota bacterium]